MHVHGHHQILQNSINSINSIEKFQTQQSLSSQIPSASDTINPAPPNPLLTEKKIEYFIITSEYMSMKMINANIWRFRCNNKIYIFFFFF